LVIASGTYYAYSVKSKGPILENIKPKIFFKSRFFVSTVDFAVGIACQPVVDGEFADNPLLPEVGGVLYSRSVMLSTQSSCFSVQRLCSMFLLYSVSRFA